MAEAQKVDRREQSIQNLQTQKDKLPSLGGTFDAIIREAGKDLRDTLHQVFFHQPEGIGEPGAPGNPTPQLVTNDLGFGNAAKSDMPDQGGVKYDPNPSGKDGPSNGSGRAKVGQIEVSRSGPVNPSDMGKDGGVHGKQSEAQPERGSIHGPQQEKAMKQNGGVHGQEQGQQQAQQQQQDSQASERAALREQVNHLHDSAQGQEQQQDKGMGH